jgi:hypothetical protein
MIDTPGLALPPVAVAPLAVVPFYEDTGDAIAAT